MIPSVRTQLAAMTGTVTSVAARLGEMGQD
jgi:hypothetical protein